MLDLYQSQLTSKTLLVRLDLDITPEELKSSSLLRITRSIPTLAFLLKHKNKLILISHRDRPTKKTSSLSLEALVPQVSNLLRNQVIFCPFFDKKVITKMLEKTPVVMLENLRFTKAEEKNDLEFAQKLASLAEAYVFEAFGVAHREHASVVGIPKYLITYPGFNFKQEVDTLSKIRTNPTRPLIAVIGGAKLETKLPVINKMLSLADKVLVGGKLLEEKLPESEKLVFPDDVWVATLRPPKAGYAWPSAEVERDWTNEKVELYDQQALKKEKFKHILDIGPVTIKKYQNYLSQAKTIVWNGPLGLFEDKRFSFGTIETAKAIGNSAAYTVAGGGETLWVIHDLGLESKFKHLSLGGGAMLDFLIEGRLSALDALEFWSK